MIFTILVSLFPHYFEGFLEGRKGQIATLQKMSPNMDDAKFISASSISLTFFGKWLFDVLNPPKSPQNNRKKVRPKS